MLHFVNEIKNINVFRQIYCNILASYATYLSKYEPKRLDNLFFEIYSSLFSSISEDRNLLLKFAMLNETYVQFVAFKLYDEYIKQKSLYNITNMDWLFNTYPKYKDINQNF